MNEFLYPVLQAYDSVAMDVDLEIGGRDQMFNMLMGRKLMRHMLKKDKFVITVPLSINGAAHSVPGLVPAQLRPDREPVPRSRP